MEDSPYSRDAARFFNEYEGIPFETAHEAFLASLPTEPGVVLDVGAGSGRDAAWFAARGHEVFAVEPAVRLRDMAADHHKNPRIHWIDDRLPSLERVRRSGTRFNAIWASAVWMHVPTQEQPRAFRVLANCLRPGGRLFISLRHGDFDDDRMSWGVSAPDLIGLARKHGLVCIAHHGQVPDLRGRRGVSWENLVFELPDDGSGAFPRLRNIILNDRKAATHKLGLLRALLRIADGSAGLVGLDENGTARVPLGLIGLYWIRIYKPLIAAGFRQAPGEQGLGFVGPAFEALDVPPSLLKPGITFSGPTASHLRSALTKAIGNIVAMPVARITNESGAQLFEATTKRAARRAGAMTLDAETLGAWGHLSVPAYLWTALRQHAVWIEPVIESEWINTMAAYDARRGTARDHESYRHALAWLSPERDTQQTRDIVRTLRARGKLVHCTWNGSRLRDRYEVDHVIPWARWPCNDLWNLAPATASANASKGDRLPSAEALAEAKARFQAWWTMVRSVSENVEQQFEQEVRATLPFVTHPSNAQDLFDGLTLLRASLRQHQQIPEWSIRGTR